MFGYIRVRKPELRIREYESYRGYYCGLCRSLKKDFGLLSQLLLSYDLTFLAILLSSVYDLRPTAFKSRCIVHPFKKQPRIVTEADDYAASMSILLGFYHFADDREDSGRKFPSAGERAFRKKAASVEKEYPRQAGVLKRELQELHSLEREGSRDIGQLAGHFGKALGEIFAWRQDIFEEELREMGYYLGRFIYVMDAVDDWEKDRKKREFNPFSDETEISAVLGKAEPLLLREISACALAFELLPAVENAEIIRNIIYAGVWNRFDMIREESDGSIRGTRGIPER